MEPENILKTCENCGAEISIPGYCIHRQLVMCANCGSLYTIEFNLELNTQRNYHQEDKPEWFIDAIKESE